MKTLTGFFKCGSIIFKAYSYARITIKGGDIYVKSPFYLARLPSVEGVHKSSQRAAFAFKGLISSSQGTIGQLTGLAASVEMRETIAGSLGNAPLSP